MSSVTRCHGLMARRGELWNAVVHGLGAATACGAGGQSERRRNAEAGSVRRKGGGKVRRGEEGWSVAPAGLEPAIPDCRGGSVKPWLPREVQVAGEEYRKIRRSGWPLSPKTETPIAKGSITSGVAGPANPHLWQGPKRYAAGGRSRAWRHCEALKALRCPRRVLDAPGNRATDC